MMNRKTFIRKVRAWLAAGAVAISLGAAQPAFAADAPLELLNVSYDPTRELLKAVNDAFAPEYEKQSGHAVAVKLSNGGSSAQARAVIDGLEADVVTLALWTDVDAIRKAGLIDDSWEQRLPNHAVPWTSTIVFVVRKGNPKQITDWPGLVKPDVQIVTPSPKTSGNGKLSFLAAWGAVVSRGGSEKDATEYVTKLYRQTPVLDSGARGATTTFAQKKIGDVHLTWENEARLEVAEANGELEIVYPPVSILAEPPVAIVDANVKRKKTEAAAEAYLRFLYSESGQEIIAKNFYRPIDSNVAARHAAEFPKIERFPITAVAKDWPSAVDKFFADGKVFDQIYQQGR
jgi:sulfate transport system substrate-binding protein